VKSEVSRKAPLNSAVSINIEKIYYFVLTLLTP
jgi:hypothetical protein